MMDNDLSDTMSSDVSDCDDMSSELADGTDVDEASDDDSMTDDEDNEEVVADLAVVVNSSLVEAAELELSVAKLNLELAEETLRLATARGKLAALQHEDCEVIDPPAVKPAKPSSAGDLTLAEQMKILNKKTKALDKRYKVLNKQIDELQSKLEQRKDEVQDKEQELSDFIAAHQNCSMVEYPGVAKWSEEKMVLGGRVLYNYSQRMEFEEKLKAAPCLKSLTLHLKERFGRRRKKMASTLPSQLCLKAPARIKELTLEFGYSSKDAVLALIERTRFHLEHLEIAGGYQHDVNYTDLDLAQFWVWLVDSNLKSLSLCSEKLLRKPFPLKAGVKFRRLEKLKYGTLLAREPTALESLIQSCSDTLRCVELPMSSGIREDELVAVFEALGQCANLEEAVLDCVAEVPRLRRCTKLKRLTFMGVSSMLRPNPGAVAAVERFLRMPTTVQRVEALTLSCFVDNTAQPIFRALPALKNLKSLVLNVLPDFPDMKKVLKELSSLEELTLNQGDFVKPTRVAEISPTVVPKLKLLKLRSERSADAAWTRKVEGIRRAFLKVNPNFKLEDETGIEKESGSEESDEGESEDLESGSTDPGLDSVSDDDEEDGPQCPVS